MAPAKNAFILCLLLALPAGAAGPLEGIRTASDAAEVRVGDAQLVEIEGFTGPDGDIPCSARSFSNNWHYKFYSASSGEWLIINACGPEFMNAAKHFPDRKAEEPVTRLPASFAEPGSVLKKMGADGTFSGSGNAGERGILVQVRSLPEKDGRPAGCYWTVSQGKAKAMADCGNKKRWKLGGTAGARLAAGPAVKGKDTAARYAEQAVAAARRKYPGSQLMAVEALADRTGSAKCVGPDDGWAFTFSAPGTSTMSAFKACRGKTALEDIDFSGKLAGSVRNLAPFALPFKDSDFALSKVPADCVQNHSTISMKLQNFKPKYSPFAGHNLVWTVDCGSLRYYLDGFTGLYLGPGKK